MQNGDEIGKTRTVIQIAMIPAGMGSAASIVALCKDGTLWGAAFSDADMPGKPFWHPIPGIPA